METIFIQNKVGTTVRHIMWLWLPVILWMGSIYFFSSRTSISISSDIIWNFLFFKTLHVIEYFILFVLFVRALSGNIPVRPRFFVFLLSYILTIVFALSDELHQLTVVTREGRLRDVIIDGIGAGIAWTILIHWLPRAPKILKNWARRLAVPY